MHNDDIFVYGGYATVCLNNEQLAALYADRNTNHFNLLTNQYLLIVDEDGGALDMLRWDGETHRPLRYKEVDNAFMGKIKPRNIQQRFAFDMLQNPDIPVKILAGCYGSGKDFMMLAHAMDLILSKGKFDKLVFVRNNVEVKNSRAVGFLPGSINDKLSPYAQIIADHVGGQYQLDNLIQRGKVELQHLGFIRGRDIKNSIIYCSEAENMTKEHVQLLLGRVSEGSQLWMNGDFRQVDHQVFEKNNGLNMAIDRLKGHQNFGFVFLSKSERSEVAAMADLLD